MQNSVSYTHSIDKILFLNIVNVIIYTHRRCVIPIHVTFLHLTLLSANLGPVLILIVLIDNFWDGITLAHHSSSKS